MSPRQWMAFLPAALPLGQCLYSGGGLTIIADNQLDGRASTGGSSILLTHQHSHLKAQSACAQLSEGLWIPSEGTSNETLTHLGYHGAQASFFSNQLYWIGSHPTFARECRTIDAAGNIEVQKDCERELPALCSQSAKVSSRDGGEDIGEKWRVKQVVGSGEDGKGKGSVFTGYRDGHVFKFRGIRFAKPPVRFEYTQGPLLETGDAENGVTALTAGADCSQPVGEVLSGSSEDCLFMNIWTPGLPSTPAASCPKTTKKRSDKKERLRPVMFYIYGGGGIAGSGKNPNTDGGNLASRGDVVSVSINYRLGNLGTLPFADGVHRGNYALSDIVTALEWVKLYIRDFGGDPDRVTVFGASAGAVGVHALLASPKAIGQGLFHRAILKSNPAGLPRNGNFAHLAFPNVEKQAATATARVLKELGCENSTTPVECLRGVDHLKLVNTATKYTGIVQDGVYLTSPELLLNGTAAPYPRDPIPVITGFNRDEAGTFLPSAPTPEDTFASYYRRVVTPSFGHLYNNLNLTALAPLIPALSPSATPNQAEILNASITVSTAGVFSCFDNAKAFTAARHGVWNPVYSYVFNHTYNSNGYTRDWCNAPNGNIDAEYYKCHGGEQMLSFGTEARSSYPERDAVEGRDYKFSRLAVDYWTAFARSGDPNPDEAYLKARGYQGTIDEIRRTGKWETVATGRSRLMQWGGKMVDFAQAELCAAMGLPVDVLEG